MEQNGLISCEKLPFSDKRDGHFNSNCTVVQEMPVPSPSMNSPADLGGRAVYAGLTFECICSEFRAAKGRALHIQYRQQKEHRHFSSA